MAGLDLSGTVELPAVGSVPKKALVGVLVAGGAFVAWRWYAARGTGGDGEESPVTDGEFGAIDTSVPTGYAAQVSGRAGESVDSGDDKATSSPTDNADWSRRITEALSADGKWSISDIATALGNYLTGQPLSTSSQDIVRAGIGLYGREPVGTHAVIPGGDATLSTAPSGVRVSATTQDTATITFSALSGATHYRAYRGIGGAVGDATASPIVVRGLTPNTTYSFTVTGVTAGGKESPASAAASGKTKALNIPAPATPTVKTVGRTNVSLTTTKIAGATSYKWYLNGKLWQASDSPALTSNALKPKTTYKVTVAADSNTQAQGPLSGVRTFTTKK